MSQENVEIVRDYLDSHGRRSPEEMTEWTEKFWDPDGNYYPVRKFPESSPRHGREAISRFQADWRATWDRIEFTIRDIVPIGDVRVLAHITMSGEGRESGARLEGDLYFCFWLRQGRIFREEDHLTVKGALRALGLSGNTLEAAGLGE
jgi:ketosteroid isomerase-like protein